MHRLTRQLRPIQPAFVRYASNKPPPSPTVTQAPSPPSQTSTAQADVPAPSAPMQDHLPIPADIVSGAPEDLHRRTVRIYRPAKGAMQSGLHGNLHWRLDWDVKPDDNRWEHPVMFWAARYLRVLALSNHSADYMQGTRMNFLTKEDAIAFAEKQGRPLHTAFGLS
jgi:NADH dehydrogenase (ubiquinone) Fe-S protein 4